MTQRSSAGGKLVSAPCVEVLEPRVLYSADGLALLHDIPGALLSDESDNSLDLSLSEEAVATGEGAHLVFVDAHLPDVERAVDALRAEGADVFLIDDDTDGIDLISETLQHYADVELVDIVTHGSAGMLELGNAHMSMDGVDEWRSAVSAWDTSLAGQADIRIYGCDLAGSAEGRMLVDVLSVLTGADVAASDDVTGHAHAGGDWELEYVVGDVSLSADIELAVGAHWQAILAEITVTTTDDVVDGDVSSIANLLASHGADGFVSLREAVLAANQDVAEDTIFLDPGDHAITIAGVDEVGQVSDLDILNSLIIRGSGADTTTVSADVPSAIFDIKNGTVEISDITIADGFTIFGGGGVKVEAGATAELNRVVVENNESSVIIIGNGQGGGIWNNGTLTLQDVEIRNNQALNDGGGIYNSGSLTMNRVTLADNVSSTGDGGGIHHTGTLLSIDNTTISGNSTDAATGGAGGGLYAEADATIENSTIVYNASQDGGGGIRAAGGGTVNLSNSILSENTNGTGNTDQDNEQGSVVSLGFNVIENTESATAIDTDILVDDPGLDPLGGPVSVVRTHALQSGSAAINAGNTDASTTDANGVVVDAIRDIGAHENESAASVLYLSNGSDSIFRANADGGNLQLLLSGRNSPGNIEVDLAGGRIYWLESDSELLSAKLDGTDIQSEANGLSDAVSFALDVATQHAYILFTAGGGIRDYNLTNGTSVAVAAGGGFNNARDIEIDLATNTLFWSDWGSGPADAGIGQVATDGTSRLTFISPADVDQPNGLAFNSASNTLYWVDEALDEVRSAPFPGSTPVSAGAVTATDPNGIVHNALDNTFLFSSPADNELQSISAVLAGNSTLQNFGAESMLGIALGVTSGQTQSPVLAVNTGVGVDEGDTVQLGSAVLQSTDDDTTDENLLYTVTDAVDAGRLYHSGAPAVAIVSFTEAQLAAGEIYYEHDGSEIHTDAFNFTVTDGTTTLAESTFSFTITPVNSQDPVPGADSLTVVEGGTATELDGGVSSVLDNDSDGDLPAATLTATVNSLPANGTLTLNNDGTFEYTHNGSETASDSFTYTVSDGQGRSDTGTVTITITPTNDAPAASDESLSVAEGATATTLTGGAASVLANVTDSDVPADTLTATVVTGPANGTLSLNSDGTFTYTHNGTETTSDSFTYQVDDGEGGTDTGTVTISITPTNDAPVASDESLSVAEGATATTLTGGAASVLANATDVDVPADTLTASVVTGPTNGTLVLNADGTFTYTHNATETTSDSFTYQVDDGEGGTDTGTVTISITPTNDAPVASDESLSVAEGATATTLTGGATSVLANVTDSDVPADTLTATVVTGPANGTLSLNPDGTFTYTHNGTETISDSFTYQVDDGEGGTDTGTVTISITPTNDAPVASDETLSLAEGATATTLTGGATFVLANVTDSDVPADTLTATVVTGPANGTLSFNPDGTFTYTHNGTETTSDSFTYQVDDGEGGTDTGTVTISITPTNDAPVASDESLSVAEGATATTLTGGAASVLANATDVDVPADTLTASVVTGPANGTLVLNADGTFTYTHNATETTSDSFTYQVDDGEGGTDTGTVTISITPTNDAPAASDESLSVAEGATATTLTGGATSVLANVTDSDVPADTLTATVVTGPANGTLSLNPDGTFTYTHNGTETISDSFTYQVDDGEGGTDTGTVTISITPTNDAPVASDETLSVAEGATATTLTGGATSVLANVTDSDVPADTLTATVVTGPANGTLSLNPDGTFTYTHNGTETTSDSFTYQVDDGEGGTDTGTVTISITPTNDAPVASDESLSVAEGATATTLTGGAASVLANATDVDVPADTLTASVVTGPANGTLVLNADGTFTYTHNGTETTSDSFTYQVDDGEGETDTATVAITVTPDNDNPVAEGDSVTVLEGGVVSVLTDGRASVLGNDTDSDDTSENLTVTLAAGPSNGTLTLNADGTFTYTHDGTDTTVDQFTYTVEDRQGAQDTATVLISITPVADEPLELLGLDTNRVAENVDGARIGALNTTGGQPDSPLSFSVSDNRFVVDGNILSLAAGQHLNFESEPQVDLTVLVIDAEGNRDEQTLFIVVEDVNDQPEANAAIEPPALTSNAEFSLPDGAFTDADGDILNYSVSLANGEALPAWIEFDSNQLALRIGDIPAGTETIQLAVVADDNRGASARVDIVLSLDAPEVPEAPVEPEPPGEPEPAVPAATTPTPAIDVPDIDVSDIGNTTLSPSAGSSSNQNTAVEPQSGFTNLAERDDRLSAVVVEHLDLSELLGPIAPFDAGALAVVSAVIRSDGILDGGSEVRDPVQTLSLLELFSISTDSARAALDDLVAVIDNQNEEFLENARFAQVLLGTSLTLSSGVTIGYLLWLIRGGTLMGSVLSSLPAWRLVDPLPVLSGMNASDAGRNDTESLESLVANSPKNSLR